MGQFEETNRVANELDPARSHGPLRRVLLAGLVIAFSIGEGAVDANDPQGNPVKAFSSLCVESANGQPGEAVVVNIANTDVVAAGYGSLRSSDDTPVYELPEKEKYSSVNFAPNESVNPNLNIVEVGADGKICYDQGPSKNNVILDEFGVFAAGIFKGEPVRIEDTRQEVSPPSESWFIDCLDPPVAAQLRLYLPNITDYAQPATVYTSIESPVNFLVAPRIGRETIFRGTSSSHLSSQVLVKWADERGYEWLNDGNHIEQACHGSSLPLQKPTIIDLPKDAPPPK
jgi:hypothetical protein